MGEPSDFPAILPHGLPEASVREGEVVPAIVVVDQAHYRRQEAVGALQLGWGEILVPRFLDGVPQLDQRLGWFL